jgi:rRNA maturation endonuclease Nob1
MMKAVTVTRWRCTCDRCGHVWHADSEPKRCASCGSPAWNRPDQRVGKFKRERISA